MNKNILDILQNVVLTSPQAKAIVDGQLRISFEDLWERSAKIARLLISRGVLPGDRVFLCLPRSADLLCSVIGIMRSGAAYVPADPELPEERLTMMFEDSQSSFIITHQSLADLHLFSSEKILTLDTVHSSSSIPLPIVTENDLAYIIFTSGSTGRPKGVAMEHGPVVLLVEYLCAELGVVPRPQVVQFAPLFFDASVEEIYTTWALGGTLYVIDEATRRDSFALAQFLKNHSIQSLYCTTVVIQALAAENVELPHLRFLVQGGEQMQLTPVLRQFLTRHPSCTLFNQYGPTECCAIVSSERIAGDVEAFPLLPSVGPLRPLLEGVLVNEDLEVVEEGELLLGGPCLARGYDNRPELTREKFIERTFAGKKSGRWYRSGDLCRIDELGKIYFLGRIDGQIKLRGFRIETGEIEVRLAEMVKKAVVILREDVPGIQRLVAYYLHDFPVTSSQFRQKLKTHLPYYMIPSAFVRVEEFLLSPTGKVDKSKLARPAMKRADFELEYVAPLTPTQEYLADLWAESLDLDRVGVRDAFFDLGGSSLLATNLVRRIKKERDISLSVVDFFAAGNIENLAQTIETGKAKSQKISIDKGRALKAIQDSDEIAVIGMAGRFPGAANVDEFWKNICAERESITFFKDEELDVIPPENLTYVNARGIISDYDCFDAEFFGISKTEAELMDPQHRVFLELSYHALENAGYCNSPDQKLKVSLYGGAHEAGYVYHHALPAYWDNISNVIFITSTDKDYLTSRVAHRLNLTGAAVTLQTACSTSLVAIIEAFHALRANRCDMALAGGVSITVPVKSGHLYQEGAMCSMDGHTRPFDAQATGTVFSDGAGLVVLKRRKDAERDGDTIYAIIKGGATNNDGASKVSFTAPGVAGQAEVITEALSLSGVNPEQISYVEAHGTATPLGDPIEVEALKKAYGRFTDNKNFCALGSVKGNIGHLTSAAGVTGFIKTVLALHHKILPASINFTSPNPHIDFEESPFYVHRKTMDWEGPRPLTAGVSAFGFGGTNAHLIVQEYQSPYSRHQQSTPQLLQWSAKSETAISKMTSSLFDYLGEKSVTRSLEDIAHTLRVGRNRFAWRSSAVVTDKAIPPRITRTVRAFDRPMAVLMFPGQGAQTIGMGQYLYKTNEVYRQTFDDCARLFREKNNLDIHSLVFSSSQEMLNQTQFAQPALFTIGYSLGRYLESLGIKPDILIGHSVGEFVAAALAGIFSLADVLNLVAIRGQLMSECPMGSMLSVRTSLASLTDLLPENLDIAAVNSESNLVVAGPSPLIDEFMTCLEDKSIPHRKLLTSHGFHSRSMEPAVMRFREILEGTVFQPPTRVIYSTATGHQLTDEEATSKDYWARQMAVPVQFKMAIGHAEKAGGNIFIECGPRATLSVLSKQSLQNGFSIPLLGEVENETSTLAALGALWERGIEIHFPVPAMSKGAKRIPLPAYPFARTQFWLKNGGPMSVLVQSLKRLIEETSGKSMKDIDPETPFLDLGFDSLLITQLVAKLQKDFRVKIPFRRLLEDLTTVNLLADFLKKQRPELDVAPVIPQAAPAVAPPAAPQVFAAHTTSSLQTIMLQQIQLMQQQMLLLSGQGLPQQEIKQQQQQQQQKQESDPVLQTGRKREIYSAKIAFGAAARITLTQTEAENTQKKQKVDDIIRRYAHKTKSSKSYCQEYRQVLAEPRVVTGFKPSTKESVYTLVVNRSKGSRLWDIDGNEYIDVLNGFGSNMFGHSPDFIVNAVTRQLNEGYEIGPMHPLVGKVAKDFCEMVKMERAGFCNTGSEAVMGCLRIARTVTGRSKVALFSGSYHGIFDEVIVRGTPDLRSLPAAPGILTEAMQNVVVLDYGTEAALEYIEKNKEDLAAVLVEPVQSRRCDFQPREFLHKIRKITQEGGAALIFDEVITGFRTGMGGAQEYFGIEADLAAYGKVIGGGFPIGIIAGKSEWVDALDGGHWKFGDDSKPEVGVTYFAGTFVRHNIAIAAADAVLEFLKEKGPSLQRELTALTADFVEKLRRFITKHKMPLEVKTFASLWRVTYTTDIDYGELLFTLLREKGVHCWDGFPCFFTTAHTKEDLDFIFQAFKEATAELIEARFYPDALPVTLFSDRPTVKGARLGRDPDGNPAWYVPDLGNPEQFVQWGRQ